MAGVIGQGKGISGMATVPKTTATRQFTGLVLARLDPAQLEPLKKLLRKVAEQTTAQMQGRPNEDAIVPFNRLETIHYARFVLLEHDAALGPQLAFGTDYDGPEGDASCSERRALSLHLDELVREAGPGLEQIFGCCRGYRRGQLRAFLEKNRLPAATAYVGSSGRSVNQIRWEAELRQRVDAVLDHGSFRELPPEAVRETVIRELAKKHAEYRGASGQLELPEFPAQPDLAGKVTAFWSMLWLLGFILLSLLGYVVWRLLPGPELREAWSIWSPTLRITVATVLTLLGVALVAWRLYAHFRKLEQTDPQFQPKYTSETHARFRTASADENYFLQNQLTHVIPIKPGLLRWLLIRAVFSVLQVLATNTYNKGKLGGIPSIHFARWVLIPNRGVLFLSNFDSSWQSYLGDFIDQASSGLTAVWSNTVGYPRTTNLLSAGSRDASRFLAWTRHHQLPTQVWYCAYPGLSIVNVNANTEIHRGLAPSGRAEVDATGWLFRLRAVDRAAVDEVYSAERTREPALATENIQGIILKGYGHMPEARYLLFRVRNASPALREWLSKLPVTAAASASRSVNPPEPLLNVAFTYDGLRALELDQALCDRFSTPFVQGSHDEYRARVNGDVGASAPATWAWGSTENPVHVLLLLFAKTKTSLAGFVQDYIQSAQRVGLEPVIDGGLEGTRLPDRKEHFGFRDGIAQPIVEGCGGPELPDNTIAAGEILLGHKDGYGNVTHSPVSSCGFAFGYDGSYLVFRQLEQDVAAFWKYCAEKRGDEAAVEVASKMVGRWPSGASLVRHPTRDPNEMRFIDEDDFSYLGNNQDNDRYGARCPFGAHIRRSNPRDWQLGETPEESRTLSNLHRIVRRGRPYGAALAQSALPIDLIAAAKSSNGSSRAAARGLQFLCFNANIERQFEFIQQQWCNNPKFAGLNSDADPLLGNQRTARELGTDAASFELQSDVKTGLAPRCTAMQNFVRVVGSSYFFMPSLAALKLLHAELALDPPGSDLEVPPPDEQLQIDNLILNLREKMKREYAAGNTLRDAHPKMHGCVKARFIVEPDLDPEYRVGLFKPGNTFDAWVRFSNQEGTVSKDSKPDIRGVAIKLLDVPGAKLLDGEESCLTHDFILISHDAFVTKDVAEFDGLIEAVVRGKVPRFLLGHWRVAWNLFQSLKRHASPLEVQYFSVAPYLWNASAVKYTLKPSSPGQAKIPDDPSPNYLREALKAHLAKGTASFDFMVQLRTRPDKMPIEDPGKRWSQVDSPFRKVATLEILKQDFDTPAQQRFGENLSFNPWRCLPAHRPLGGISRARRQVYKALSAFRHDRNAEPREEPSDLSVPTDSLRFRNAREHEKLENTPEQEVDALAE
jgi:Dyp-type peroxidase family